ncbi:MAG: antioxidant protein [Pseudomonadota bacterium]|jgi:peroxiredoxin Q/BCP
MTQSTPLSTGDSIPALPLETSRGAAQLTDFIGHQLVIYFYPKDDTPGCTVEGQDFTRLHADFLAANTQVIGVSRDSVASHQKFIEKYQFSLTLVSDPTEALCNLFGVMKDKNMYGKTVRGVERSTFLVDAQGKLQQAWRGVKVPGHAEAVLEAARALSSSSN